MFCMLDILHAASSQKLEAGKTWKRCCTYQSSLAVYFFLVCVFITFCVLFMCCVEINITLHDHQYYWCMGVLCARLLYFGLPSSRRYLIDVLFLLQVLVLSAQVSSNLYPSS